MAGMLSSATANPDTGAAAQTAPPDPNKDMYHDYLTNPNSTYGQDPTLSGQLKSATADGIAPGSLTGTPDEVAKQGLKPEAYSSLYDINSPGTTTEGLTGADDSRLADAGMMFSQYNGTGVRTDDAYKQSIQEGADSYNKRYGTTLSAQDYDAQLNPTSYGARWGIPQTAKPAPTAGTPAMYSYDWYISQGKSPAVAKTMAEAAAITGHTGAPGSAVSLSGGAPGANVAGYAPSQTALTPGMMSADRLAQMMDPNSPLMVQAATQGNQQANKRGLQNSSIGISAAQDSMLRAATPFALQDAQTAANVGLSNTGAINTAGQFNAGAQNTSTLTGQQLESQQKIAKDQIASQQQIARLNADTSVLTAKMSTEAQAALAAVNNQHQKLIQSNSQAATAMNNYAATVANIQASKDMDGSAKQAAVDTQLTMLRNTLTALESQSGQNLEQYFPMIASTAPPADPGTGNWKLDELGGYMP
jgi:hypothetical protein